MGNCFSKRDGNFHGEGRSLGSEAPARPANAGYGSIPSSSSTPQGGRQLGKTNPSDQGLGPREAAAKAAETRAAAAQGQGKGALGQKLNQQKQQSQNATLVQNAKDNVAARDADNAAAVRSYN